MAVDAEAVTVTGLLRGASPSGSAFRRVFLAEYPAVLRHLTYLVGDRQAAEDLAQETFGRLLERGPEGGVDGLRNPRAWLLTVASNLAYNHFRSETHRLDRERGLTGPEDADVDDVIDVRRVLAGLDSRDRAVLMLRCSGFSYAEIAEAVGLAASSVGTTLARAQHRFREAYGSSSGPDAATAGSAQMHDQRE
jgi:RNA polymerase sigma factor (sigma-70 family)